ncbi:DNA-directed RNA polymerase subunit alpha C-terminal domain-containing protein [Lachnospiraceae bacterium HCP1S3_C3]
MKIKDLGISARARSCLLNAGYEDVCEIRCIGYDDLKKIRNLNDKCIEEILREIQFLNETVFSQTINKNTISKKTLEKNTTKIVSFSEYKDRKLREPQYEIVLGKEIYSHDDITIEFYGVTVSEECESIWIHIAADNDTDNDIDVFARNIQVNNRLEETERHILSASFYSTDFQSIDVKGTNEISFYDIQSIKFDIDVRNEKNRSIFVSETIEIQFDIYDRKIKIL